MFNSKVIVAAAVVGFLLSFFTGIFSGVGFGFVVLRAIIFAAILALLAVGVSYIFEKFLDIFPYKKFKKKYKSPIIPFYYGKKT